jgi:hypothetical protein
MGTKSAPNPNKVAAAGPTAKLQEAIGHRAREIYEHSGRAAGQDVQNWIQAEAEIRREFADRATRKTAIVVTVAGVQYVGQYDPAFADGYAPGEFAYGNQVPVRFKGEKMYVKRPNGKELETTIVKQVTFSS